MYIPRIILAFLVPAVFAQYHTRETRTPSLDFLHTVFGKEALNELPNDDEVARLASLEWARCETDSTKRPFLACTTSTSESVQTLLTEVPLHIPLMNDGNRTCFVVHETKDRVLEVLPALEVAIPLPSIFKIAEGFFDRMDSGGFVGNACQKGYR